MRWPRGVDLTPARVRAALTPQERLLADVQVTTFAQGSAVGGTPRPNVGMDWSPVLGGVTVDEEWLGGTLTGYSAGGQARSVADHFARVLEDLGIGRLLLTTSRLALYGTGASQRGAGVLTFSVDRRWLTEARVAPRLLQHGRLRLEFADGSWAMPMAGVLLPTAARRFVRAWRESR